MGWELNPRTPFLDLGVLTDVLMARLNTQAENPHLTLRSLSASELFRVTWRQNSSLTAG